jgi:hypothetical protein
MQRKKLKLNALQPHPEPLPYKYGRGAKLAKRCRCLHARGQGSGIWQADATDQSPWHDTTDLSRGTKSPWHDTPWHKSPWRDTRKQKGGETFEQRFKKRKRASGAPLQCDKKHCPLHGNPLERAKLNTPETRGREY